MSDWKKYTANIRRLRELRDQGTITTDQFGGLSKREITCRIGVVHLADELGIGVTEVMNFGAALICRSFGRHIPETTTCSEVRHGMRRVTKRCTVCDTKIFGQVQQHSTKLKLEQPTYDPSSDYAALSELTRGRGLFPSDFNAAAQYLELLREIDLLERPNVKVLSAAS